MKHRIEVWLEEPRSSTRLMIGNNGCVRTKGDRLERREKLSLLRVLSASLIAFIRDEKGTMISEDDRLDLPLMSTPFVELHAEDSLSLVFGFEGRKSLLVQWDSTTGDQNAINATAERLRQRIDSAIRKLSSRVRA